MQLKQIYGAGHGQTGGGGAGGGNDRGINGRGRDTFGPASRAETTKFLIAGYSNGPENGTVVILRKILIISAAGGDYEGIHISREKEYLW